MYKVWFKFVDRYYINYNKAREACRNFIISQKEDERLTSLMLDEFEQFDKVQGFCGIEEIRFEDEVPACVPCEPKKNYKVIFKKSEVVEVLAYSKEEAEALADRALEDIAFCWEGPADEIIVEEVQ